MEARWLQFPQQLAGKEKILSERHMPLEPAGLSQPASLTDWVYNTSSFLRLSAWTEHQPVAPSIAAIGVVHFTVEYKFNEDVLEDLEN